MIMKVIDFFLLFLLFIISGCDNSENIDGPGSIVFGEIYGEKVDEKTFEVEMGEPVCYSQINCYDSNDWIIKQYKNEDYAENFSIKFNGAIILSMSQITDSDYRIELEPDVPSRISRIEISWESINASKYDVYIIDIKRNNGGWELLF